MSASLAARPRTPLRAVAIAILAGFAAACSASKQPGNRTFKLRVHPADAGGAYVFLTAKSSGAGTALFPNRRLWKSFRVESTLGFFDPAHADLGADGTFGLTLLEASGVGRYFFLEIRRDGDGIRVDANGGAGAMASLTLPDSLVADVAMETVGGLLFFYARKPGDAEYTPIVSAVAPSAGPYLLRFDCSEIPKQTSMGFGIARVASNGEAPSPAPREAAQEMLYRATDAVIDAFALLNRSSPDRQGAADDLDLAAQRIDEALATPSADIGSARKAAAKVRKKAAKLASAARGTKRKAGSLLKSLFLLVVESGEAAHSAG